MRSQPWQDRSRPVDLVTSPRDSSGNVGNSTIKNSPLGMVYTTHTSVILIYFGDGLLLGFTTLTINIVGKLLVNPMTPNLIGNIDTTSSLVPYLLTTGQIMVPEPTENGFNMLHYQHT